MGSTLYKNAKHHIISIALKTSFNTVYHQILYKEETKM